MTQSRVRKRIAGSITAGVLVLVVLALGLSRPGESKQADQPKKARPEGKPVAMPANLVGLEITLGLKDKEQVRWDGEVKVSEGKVLEVSVARGGPKAKVDGPRFIANSTLPAMMMQQQGVAGVLVGVYLDAPQSAAVTVETKQGKIEFKLSDLAAGAAKTFLDGQASVERQEGAVRLTGRSTEDDFPALAAGKFKDAWLAYVEYVPADPIVPERIKAGAFDTLVPRGNGDQVLLMRFNGTSWEPPVEATGPGLDVWRPTVAVDGGGVVYVAWSQQVDGDWEIFYRRFTPPQLMAPEKDKPPKGIWHDPVRVTKNPGSDFHVVATTDSDGKVWLAWQSWLNDNFDIVLTSVDGQKPGQPQVISGSKANDWAPTIAADSKGSVFVAWDTYDKGNYDIRLGQLAKGKLRMMTVASLPRFEARPSIVCDGKDRVWIAYEEGDEQWGKDYANAQFKNIKDVKGNPGYGLYINRTVKVQCFADGKWMQPAGDLQKVLDVAKGRNKSHPRLSVDGAGGLWLLYRQHPLPGGAGEVWNSYAVRYQGKEWSSPRPLLGSANLLDNRPAIIPHGSSVLTVYSGDGRVRTANRDQDDLFAAILSPFGATAAPELSAVEQSEKAKLDPVHANEAADVARMRGYRVEAGGKKLRLLRGEFHRHTEYSAHRDIDGSLEDSWRYALDAGALDWMGNGDHDNGATPQTGENEYMWWQVQKISDLFQNPPHFVAAMTYERSVTFPDGHRNVMMPKRGIRPLPRQDRTTDEKKGTHDTKVVYAYLKHFGGICASHTSGSANMGTDWRDNDPLVEPIVEIYQGHRHNYEHAGAPRAPTKDANVGGYQEKGHIWDAFDKGYRFGFQASSDHVSTHMSYAIALAEEPSRQGLIDAFKKRRCYAATDNILLDVRMGDHIMGDAFESAKRPTLSIVVHGTGPIAKLHVIRDNKYVYSDEPKKNEVKLTYTDMDAKAGKTSFYYVRVEQADGNLAWGSPVWITYKP